MLGYLTYEILQPFLAALAWAAVFSIVFLPGIYFYIAVYQIYGFCIFLTVVLILFVIVGPFFSLSFVLLKELRAVAEKLDNEALDSIKGVLNDPVISRFTAKLQSHFGIKDIEIGDIIVGNLKKFGESLLNNLSLWVSNIARIIIDFIFMSFAIFFLLKDGPDFLNKIKAYLPFSDEQKTKLASQTKDMIVSTVYGGIMVAMVQGLLGGIAFFALDIKSPVLWGTTMAIMSFLPMLGTFTVWGRRALTCSCTAVT